ncbi:MAG TPA: hypothetical protein VGR30_15930 [Candidatus Binatia bacterium]|nr:hypothetical protein [Candidatus Binatia bacterium]
MNSWAFVPFNLGAAALAVFDLDLNSLLVRIGLDRAVLFKEARILPDPEEPGFASFVGKSGFEPGPHSDDGLNISATYKSQSSFIELHYA